MSDYLPPGTSDRDADAPWNQIDDDGADVAHGIAAVTGDNPGSMLETFSEFIADCSKVEERLIESSEFWLRANSSNADLLKILLTEDGVHSAAKVKAALIELRARYLADPYTQRVIATHADDWVQERREDGGGFAVSARESEGHASAVRVLAITPAARLAEIKTRRLDIQATLLEWKRAYFLDGVARSIEQRIELQAEDARLALEANTLKAEAYRAEGERLARLPSRNELLNALQRLVTQVETGFFDDVSADHPNSAVHTARALIAKAKAVQP